MLWNSWDYFPFFWAPGRYYEKFKSLESHEESDPVRFRVLSQRRSFELPQKDPESNERPLLYKRFFNNESFFTDIYSSYNNPLQVVIQNWANILDRTWSLEDNFSKSLRTWDIKVKRGFKFDCKFVKIQLIYKIYWNLSWVILFIWLTWS